MISGHVVIGFEPLAHLRVIALPVQQVESSVLHRVADPVQGRGLAQHRPPASVEHASDQPVFRIVVLRLGILVHVETGEPSRPSDVVFIIRIAVAQQVEYHQTLGVMGPVAVYRKLLVVHAFPGEGHVYRLRFRILADVSVLRRLAHVQDAVSPTEQVDDGPVGQVLDGIVRTVQGAPAGHAFQVALFVEVLFVEQFERLRHEANE